MVNLRLVDEMHDGASVHDDQKADLDSQLAEMTALREEEDRRHRDQQRHHRPAPPGPARGLACVQNALSHLDDNVATANVRLDPATMDILNGLAAPAA